MRRGLFLLFVSLLCSPVLAEKGKVNITWLGHATFEIVTEGGTNLLVDPFIKGNPATPSDKKDLSKYKPKAILVSHSHPDHSADVLEIAKTSGAVVISSFEFVKSLGVPDAQQMGGNVGGTFNVGDASVTLVPAMHSSDPGGRPMGFIIKLADGRSIYHTGDTWIFSDMALIEELYHPNILLMNMGGGPFTQDAATAALAVKKYFKPSVIVPMHFGTFPILNSSKDIASAFAKDKRLVEMKPGETRAF